MEFLDLTADHSHFFYEGKPFLPLIAEDQPIVPVTLNARLSSDLDWQSARSQVEDLVSHGKWIFWELDFGWETFSLSDPLVFQSFAVALNTFSKGLLTEFAHCTFGVGLYRGDLELYTRLQWSGEQRSYLEETLCRSTDEAKTKRLFCTRILSEYLHRLASHLPDAVLCFCLIDVSAIKSRSEVAQLLSKQHFQHLHLVVRGASIPLQGLTWQCGASSAGWMGKGTPMLTKKESTTIGICLPPDELLRDKVAERLEKLLAEKTSYRLIAEEQLTQEWDGLDEILFIEGGISAQGVRKQKGFIAAGGQIIVVG